MHNKFKRKSSSNLQEILQRSQFQKKKTENDTEPVFDCSGGLHLSDSSDSESDGESGKHRSAKATSSHLSSINQGASGTTSLDLKAVHDNYQKMEKAKAQLAAYKNSGTSGSQKENLNIADLLAMGEGSSSKKAKKVHNDDSDDDWEEVEGKRTKVPRYMKILRKFEFEG